MAERLRPPRVSDGLRYVIDPKGPTGDESIMVTMEKTESTFDAHAMIRKLSMESDLDGVDLRVFLYLFSRLDFENFTRVEQRDIAEALQRRKEHVSRSIRKLKAKKVIIEASPKVGRSSAYLLNPKYGK